MNSKGILPDASTMGKSVNEKQDTAVKSTMPLIGKELSTSSLDSISLNYSPLVLLPSVGFGAALGLDSSHQRSHFGSPKVLKNR